MRDHIQYKNGGKHASMCSIYEQLIWFDKSHLVIVRKIFENFLFYSIKSLIKFRIEKRPHSTLGQNWEKIKLFLKIRRNCVKSCAFNSKALCKNSSLSKVCRCFRLDIFLFNDCKRELRIIRVFRSKKKQEMADYTRV